MNFSNYATKSDLKRTTNIDISKFAKKAVLASLKSNSDKFDIDKLETTPANLINTAKNFVKKTAYDDLVKNY